ncbi:MULTISPECIES: response regulator transcription factor [unclassified Bacillus (in: firmicutes)]|uniref:response regulator transcription factor n=1 Tax=unclassified Bacillus (in: firmicutes) TaxID=185979 RepID=UPI0008EFD01F|nr:MULTISPECIES: response regulator transcription factor [unclassified Bacillus (in: firmicutes)]SFI08281.1 DNA-binding response regulator, OmpR family, contains REC and winged-helix (wHTH) domain [Bacillus sp. 71mf]SFS77711.1 DNA-binding response regulator, OmpR family, contains REC and winged-helix (wHTH) domain [Bacillus sp. 103mf]
MKKKLLLIEDDVKLIKYMKEYLGAYDYLVETIKDFDHVEEEIYKAESDLILLDINLPKFDGFYFLKVIRKKLQTPIIIVSSRSEEGEQVRGIDLGADDYITKPFSMGILLAKINAVLRRVNNLNENMIEIKNVKLFCESMEIRVGHESIPLSKNEYKLLKIFFTNYEKVVTREELLEELWDKDEFVDDNTLTVNITRLKKRLKEKGIQLTIETKRGIGYVLK